MTRRQAAILAFIATYLREHTGHSPALRDIMAGCGIKSPATAYYNILVLQAKGHIGWEPRLARTIRIIKALK